MPGSDISLEKRNALHLGEPLVVEVPASDPSRRAWVSIFPRKDEADRLAERDGWRRSAADREYYVWLGEVARDFDDTTWDLHKGENYWRVKSATISGEEALIGLLRSWSVPLDQLQYPARTDYPF